MSQTFTKLASSITESTIWLAPDPWLRLWVCMLAMSDQYGRVFGSVPGLAHRARVPLEDARAALAAFMEPDPDSRTPDNEGRRIEVIDGGWRLLNYTKYREARAADDRREQTRLAQRRRRERLKAERDASSGTSSSVITRHQGKPRSAQAEAEAEAEAEKEISASLRKPRRQRNAVDRLPPCPFQTIVDLYHDNLPELPRVKVIAIKKRKAAMVERWEWVLKTPKLDGSPRATSEAEAVEWWRGYFARAATNDFVMGRTGRGPGHENWQAGFDYLLTESGMTRVIEGR